MNVHWTESALAGLRAIEVCIARHSSQHAHALIERIFARSGQREAHPWLGPVVQEYDEESLRELFEAPDRIVYRVGEHQIDVVAVIPASRRMPRGI